MRLNLEGRLLAKVKRSHETPCWIWTGATAGRPGARYGRIYSGTRTAAGHPRSAQAHRVAYEIYIGPIPDGLEVDHLCRNTLCVNPLHLEPVTYEENQRRGNSPMAKQARQTHCKRGHALDEQNTYTWHGMRRCRRCNADVAVAIRAKRKRVAELSS